MINFKKLFSSAEPVKIGHLTPLSGEYAYFGEWEKEGVDLAAEELNKKAVLTVAKLLFCVKMTGWIRR
jgi:ABC-type branched-chain amino acid transport systems, periplasmic component